MAQLGSRGRKRNAIESSDDDEGTITTAIKASSNTLTNFLIPSPTKPPPRIAPLALSASSPTSHHGPIFSQPEPHRPATRSSRRTTQLVSSSSPAKTSPHKKQGQRQPKRLKIEGKGKTTDIKAMFANQAQGPMPPTTTVPVRIDDIFTSSDPILDDDDDDDDGFANYKASTTSVVGETARKRQKKEGAGATFACTAFADPFSQSPNASQLFRKTPTPAMGLPSPEEDHRPWPERFGPENLEELAVHKRKVADVQRWLEEVLAGRIRQRLLVLKGAAGSGKTTTLRLLARDLGCDVLEWRNPTGWSASAGGQSASFASFLGSGGKFGALDVGGGDDDDAAIVPTVPNRDAMGAPKQTILLVEEFPNTSTRSSSAMTSFRSTVQEFLAKSTPPPVRIFGKSQSGSMPVMPVVMIISETLLTTASATADIFTAYRLLGPDILRHPGTGVIEFNGIAPTLLARALQLVVQKEARQSGRKKTPGPLVIKRLGEMGDIRSAISSLEFLCVKGDHAADWGSKVSFAKTTKRGAKREVSLTRGEQESLELVSQREASLGIFHAVGKVVYNKREERPRSDDNSIEWLPDHIRHHSRPHRSLVSVDNLIDETGTDTHTFILALHENYALSCEPASPTEACSSLDYVNDCLEYLSEADLMCPGRDSFFGSNSMAGGYGGRDVGSHVLRQDEMAFQVASRGLLFSLPFPVKRKPLPSARGGDIHKLFYPTSLKLWRSKEEIEGLVEMWSSKMLKGEQRRMQQRNVMDGASMFRKPPGQGQGQGQGQGEGHGQGHGQGPPTAPSAQRKAAEPEPAPLTVSLGNAARTEMILERLPYMAHISRAQARTGGAEHATINLRNLDRVVAFGGIDAPSEDPADDDDDDYGGDAGGLLGNNEAMAWATDRPSEGPPQMKKKVGIQARRRIGGDGLEEPDGLDVRSLVISDDDIEDD